MDVFGDLFGALRDRLRRAAGERGGVGGATESMRTAGELAEEAFAENLVDFLAGSSTGMERACRLASCSKLRMAWRSWR